ncbi:hypothetical protein [Williamsia sp.]|uniref:hypothetical protein n=1 Tax=Williamsia sp. TaxID=1872085 RepID=UPI002F945D90
MSYATRTELAGQWRTLSGTEEIRADALLDMAGILIDHHVDLGGLAEGDWRLRVAKQVSIDMVIEALAPESRGGVSQYQVELDDAIESATYREGSDTSTITFTKGMRALFGMPGTGQTPVGSFGDCL